MAWPGDILQYAFDLERAAPTPYTFATTFLPACLSYYTLAVLVQLPHTGLYRAVLLPVVFWTGFRANISLDFSWNDPGLACMNQGLAIGMFIIAMRSMVWAFADKPFRRLPVGKIANGTSRGQNGTTLVKNSVSVASALWDAWDLTINLRNIGWVGPYEIHVPTPSIQAESKLMFSLLSLSRFTLGMVVLDALCRCIQSFGPDTFGTPKGGTIFDPALPPIQRYMRSSLITLLFGPTAFVMIEASYQGYAVLFMALFGQYPWQWPPLFDAPWLSTSLHSLWGRRWHQLFREPFVVLGSVGGYLGRVGTLMGAFAISGALHDVGIRGMARGADTPFVMGFFLMQGVGVLLEHAWRRVMGSRVGGLVGWAWTVIWLVCWGQLIVDAWARKGLLGAPLCPDAYSPSALLWNWVSRKSGIL